ncbi:hypothetical protein TI03_00240 [Achromatium sp. WMS1]|nr:hypothetical protein TI03_00240 [Achromatium sp. WMS1]
MIINKKVCIIGGFAVGKTSLVHRYVLSEFSPIYKATLGVNIHKYSDTIKTQNKGEIMVNQVIWDVEGSTTRQELLKNYIRGSSGTLVVGDVSREDSLDDMITHAELFEKICPARPIVFAFNKIDLLQTPFVYDGNLYQRFGGLALQTSAATGHAVLELFRTLAARIIELGV